MTTPRGFILGFVLLLAACANGFAQSPDPLVETLDVTALPPAWEVIITDLQANGRLRAAFEERRTFTFRARPVALRGELRLDPVRGLSLHYLEPESHTVIVDQKGVLIRDEAGRARAAPKEAAAASKVLLQAVRFNLADLAADYLIRGRRQENDWILWLEPRGRDGGLIELRGHFDQVRHIHFQPTARRQIDLTLTRIETVESFAPAELAEYFR